MTKYTDIIERLQNATGPDREIDTSIWMLVTKGATRRHQRVSSATYAWKPYVIDETRDAQGVIIVVPSYTASIDAAIALVERMLSGKVWYVRGKSDGTFFCQLYTSESQRGNDPKANAPSAPLAILVALFRALEAQEAAQ